METNANPNFANQTLQLLFKNRTNWKLNSCMQGLDLSLHRVDSEEGGVFMYLKFATCGCNIQRLEYHDPYL